MPILKLAYENPKTKVRSTGKIEIKNQTSSSADLYFYGDICSSTWDLWQNEDMCPQDVADFLNSLVGVQEINMYINSGGGDSFAGLAIYNMLTRNPAKKNCYIDGLAASAASAIAMAGDILIMPPGAQLMIHNAWTIAMGDANDFRAVADTLDKVSQSYVDVYSANSLDDITSDQIKQMMDNTTWLTGTEATQYFKNIQIEGTQIAAYADSQYFSKYKTVPQEIFKRSKSQKKPLIIHDGVVPPNISTDTAPEDESWNAPNLSDFTDKQWSDLTDQEKRDIAGHFAWAEEMPPDAYGNLKFPHHDPKTHKVVWQAIVNAAARIDQADIPDADKPKVKTHIEEHYHQFDKKAPWETDNSEEKLKLEKAKALLALELSL